MKKIVCLILIALFIVLSCFGCSKKIVDDNTVIRIGGLKGPTSLGLVKLLDDSENGNTDCDYSYTIAGSADELTPKFLGGELDIIAVPVNLGAVLNSKTDGDACIIAVNTLGVTYILEKGENSVSSFADLKGKTIFATGKGSVPEYSLSYLLSQHGLEIGKDVTVEWKNEPTEIVALMKNSEYTVAMLPQPYVTVAMSQLEDARIVLDMTEEWDGLENGTRLVTAGLIANKEFVEAHPELVKAFLAEYAESVGFINSNPESGAALSEKFNIIKSDIAEKAIPYCNIVCITGDEMKSILPDFLKILYDYNPASVGGKMPDENFCKTFD